MNSSAAFLAVALLASPALAQLQPRFTEPVEVGAYTPTPAVANSRGEFPRIRAAAGLKSIAVLLPAGPRESALRFLTPRGVSAGIRISVPSERAAVLFDGVDFRLFWSDQLSRPQLHAERYSEDGVLLSQPTILPAGPIVDAWWAGEASVIAYQTASGAIAFVTMDRANVVTRSELVLPALTLEATQTADGLLVVQQLTDEACPRVCVPRHEGKLILRRFTRDGTLLDDDLAPRRYVEGPDREGDPSRPTILTAPGGAFVFGTDISGRDARLQGHRVESDLDAFRFEPASQSVFGQWVSAGFMRSGVSWLLYTRSDAEENGRTRLALLGEDGALGPQVAWAETLSPQHAPTIVATVQGSAVALYVVGDTLYSRVLYVSGSRNRPLDR